MRMLAVSGIALAAVLVVLLALAAWLLGTPSGLRFAVARTEGALAGRLSIGHADGTLGGLATLRDVRYRDRTRGIDASIASIRIGIAPAALFAWRVHVTDLSIANAEVSISPPTSTSTPTGRFSLEPPIDIRVDRAVIENMVIDRPGASAVSIESAEAAGAWTTAGISIDRLAVRAPDGTLDLSGAAVTKPGFAARGDASFNWRVDRRTFTGTLTARPGDRLTRATMTLTAPTALTIEGTVGTAADLPWTVRVDAPAVALDRLVRGSDIESAALSLSGSGTRTTGSVSGNVAINAHRIDLDRLRWTLPDDSIRIDEFALSSPDIPGHVEATGTVHPTAAPPSVALVVDWQGVELPPDLAGEPLATHGSVKVDGNTAQYSASGAFAIGPPGRPTEATFTLDGRPQDIELTNLVLKQGTGRLEAHGTLSRQPPVRWDLAVKAHAFDPGAFMAGWTGAVDADVASSGTLMPDGPDANIRVSRLGGTLRGRPLSGSGALTVKPGYAVDGQLQLASGRSRIDVTGRGGATTDARARFTIASLDDWLPRSTGRIDGTLDARGRWPDLTLDLAATTAGITAAGITIDRAHIDGTLRQPSRPSLDARIDATGVAIGNARFAKVSVNANGNAASHSIDVRADGTPAGVVLDFHGSLDATRSWHGTLRSLDLKPANAPEFALEAPVQVDWNGARVQVANVCLAGEGASACVGGDAARDGSLKAHFRMRDVPLPLVARLVDAGEAMTLAGTLDGTGSLQRNADGKLAGDARVTSASGNAALRNAPDSPLVEWTGFQLATTFGKTGGHATVHATLDHGGSVSGEVRIDGPVTAASALSGSVDAKLGSLAFIDLLTPALAGAKGRADARYTLAGTLAAPQVTGALDVEGFAVEMPAAGISLRNGTATLRASDAEHLRLAGRIDSGKGSLAFSGTAGLAADVPFELHIAGENFLAADIPSLHVLVSPKLVVRHDGSGFDVRGSVAVPESRIDLEHLPGGHDTALSPDVVVVDAPPASESRPAPIAASVDVTLGKDVKVSGYGLDGRLGGNLRVAQRPDRSPTGTGTLTVRGTYKAYGQNLTIRQGRLLFAGTPLDDPGLDIRAERVIRADDVTAGLSIRGTATAPVMTVYSEPVMEQSDALSYLVTGKPLSSLKSGEGDMLGSAARALGSATGDLLARGIGARLGVDAGVADSDALGGAAFTVGKYLSPKLYVSYGVGLFTPGEVVTLRYLFSRRWNFEAENATTGNRAGINWRWAR